VAAAPRAGGRPVEAERFLAFALTAADLLIETGGDGRIGFAAGAFEIRFGQPAQNFVGRPVELLVAPGDRAAFATAFEVLRTRGRMAPTAFRLSDRRATSVVIAGLSRPDGGGPCLCLTVGAMPAAAVVAGPATASVFQAAAEAALRGDSPTAISLMELTGADGPISPRAELLRQISENIAATAGPQAVVGELGAGRFGLVSDAQTDFGAIAARLEAMVRDCGIAASVSATSVPLDAQELTTMQATRALRYVLQAFSRGGGNAVRESGFDGGLPGFVASACARAESIRQIIAARRFRLAFQPICALRDRAHHHYEALLRPIQTPGNPLAGTQEFVAFAEAVGLSAALDWAVVETVVEAAQRAGGHRIACNLSGLSVQDPAFRERLLAMLATDATLAERLLVEITETAEIDDEAEAQTTIEALRDVGLPICIDDFGAGAAAFRYLRAFRADYVKIDGSYVQKVTGSDQDRGFVASMVDLARNVGAQVVAERVETEAELRVLRALGVEYGQGWLFGRPGPLPGSL
jgi:EAL domain-containing protein (putative c-di-GMP-specific phosphodiesterase class I)